MLKKQMIQTKITFANIRIKYEQSGIDRKFLNLFLDKTVYIYIYRVKKKIELSESRLILK